MAEIKMSGGYVAVIDDSDYERFSRYTWRADIRPPGIIYAIRQWREGGKTRKEYLHRAVLQVDSSVRVDHKNHNGLDCRRENLRPATQSQNIANSRRSRVGRSSQYRGVVFDVQTKKWRAYAGFQGKNVWGGRFNSEEEAARKHDELAKLLHGDFATVNFS